MAVIGTPAQPAGLWTPEVLAQMNADGFTDVQLNIAWSYRPNDEPLNLEDVWPIDGPLPARSLPGEVNQQRRRTELMSRSRMAKAAGLRTLFHFGAPYNGRLGYDGERLLQCISDPTTAARYVTALHEFGAEMGSVDDLLVYTYDQDAWLCSEFGGCDRCLGVPVHLRVSAFLNDLAQAWKDTHPAGRFWWEPWELSAGQTLACVKHLDPENIGLMMHSSIAEVISTLPGDIFLQNIAALARDRGIPVIAEVFMSSSNEEVEPWTRLPVPLVTWSQLAAVEAIPGIVGVKEYFGIVPADGDVNLAAARQYFRDPELSHEALLKRLAVPYELQGSWLEEFWTQASLAYTLYPWNSSWFARQLGRSTPIHELSAATIRGMQSGAAQWDTPAWRSSRAAVFARTENSEPNSWLLEDIQLRFAAAAETMEVAVGIFDDSLARRSPLAADLDQQLSEAIGFITRSVAYECHLRASNIASLLGLPSMDAVRRRELFVELERVLERDLANQERELRRVGDSHDPASPPVQISDLQSAEKWVVANRSSTRELREAIEMLRADPDAFIRRYLGRAPDTAAAGQFTLTSR